MFVRPKVPKLDASQVQSAWTSWSAKFKVKWVMHVCQTQGGWTLRQLNLECVDLEVT